jgi:hypothetical protein
MDDEGDDMNDQEREALDRVLLASFESAKAGELRPASTLLDELRHQR